MIKLFNFIIWWVVKTGFSIIFSLNWILRWLNSVIDDKFIHREDGTISKEIIKLGKLPIHLGVIFLPKDLIHPLTYLSSLAKWCILSKIKFLTVYLPTLPKELTHDTFNSSIFSVQVKSELELSCQFDPSKMVIYHTRNNEKPALSIRLRDSSSYNEELLRAAEGAICAKSDPSHTTESIYKGICRDLLNGSFPEPNLVIAPGLPLRLFGFPPMLLRAAEFYENTVSHRLYYKDFYNALKGYSLSQQRNGK